jgi:hypothetical protein
MSVRDHTQFEQLLAERADQALADEQLPLLEEHLRSCSSCRAESLVQQRLQGALRALRVPVEEGFVDRVLVALPAPAAGAPTRQPWIVAVALMLALAGGAALLSAGAQSISSPLATLAALAEFAGTTLLAGAGLLTASWQGLGLLVASFLQASLLNLVFAVVLLVALDWLLLRLLLRRVQPVLGRSRSRRD